VLPNTRYSFHVVHTVNYDLTAAFAGGVIGHMLYNRLRLNLYLPPVVLLDMYFPFTCTVR
jgi:hypothetical protein